MPLVMNHYVSNFKKFANRCINEDSTTGQALINIFFFFQNFFIISIITKRQCTVYHDDELKYG